MYRCILFIQQARIISDSHVYIEPFIIKTYSIWVIWVLGGMGDPGFRNLVFPEVAPHLVGYKFRNCCFYCSPHELSYFKMHFLFNLRGTVF